MKKIFVLLYALVLIFCTSCKEKSVDKGELEYSIFIATDLHLYSNNLIGEANQKYTKKIFTSDGRIQEYDYQLVELLIQEVNKEKPKVLLLTGDLSYNGEKDSHLELAKMLSQINSETKVLVIPGNHDCYSLNTFTCLNDEVKLSTSVTYEEFKEIYKDFGYSNAYSYDETSLSYIYEIDENNWVLMLDTNMSEYNVSSESNITMGMLDKNTLAWIEENIKYAKENNINVISATHHNLAVHNIMFESSYTLDNADELLELYNKYGVKFNFSGHLHIQSIKEVNGVVDIVNTSLLAYGNHYGKFNIYNNYYEYETIDLASENLKKISFDNFYIKYYEKNVSTMSKLFDDKGEEINDFISKVNCYYFDGNYEMISKLKKQNRALFKNIKNTYPRYENSYLKTILEVEDENQNYLLVERKVD